VTEATYPPTAQALPQTWDDRVADDRLCKQETLACLYAAHAAQLYRYFWMRTRSQALAEDLVSETFLAALRSLPGYCPSRGTISAWLFGIARHALTRQVGKLDRAGARPIGEAQAPAPPVSLDERIDLWQAVARLPDLEQEAVALRFGAGQTYPEIARIMGLQATHVGVLLYRALQRLRTWLDDEAGGDVE